MATNSEIHFLCLPTARIKGLCHLHFAEFYVSSHLSLSYIHCFLLIYTLTQVLHLSAWNSLKGEAKSAPADSWRPPWSCSWVPLSTYRTWFNVSTSWLCWVNSGSLWVNASHYRDCLLDFEVLGLNCIFQIPRLHPWNWVLLNGAFLGNGGITVIIK